MAKSVETFFPRRKNAASVRPLFEDVENDLAQIICMIGIIRNP